MLDHNIISGVTTRVLSDNLEALAQVIGRDPESMIRVQQVHGDAIVHANDHADSTTTNRSVGGDASVMKATVSAIKADALISQRSDVTLCVRIADCAGVLLWDPSTSTIAAVHSGWRGTAQNIVGKCIRRMVDVFDCNPSNIRAYISPCASGERYEVREDVAGIFLRHVRKIRSDAWLFDNRGAIDEQLVVAGVSPNRICSDSACTISDERFHSYRRDGMASGRCVAFIGLRSLQGIA